MKAIELTLTVEMLGTKANRPDIFDQYQASLNEDAEGRAEEIANAAALPPKDGDDGMTVFHRDVKTGLLGVYDYQIKGFIKEAAQALNRFDKEYRGGMEKMPAFKTKISQCLFVYPRFIPFVFEGGTESLGVCQRPLVGQTAQGQRIALAKSETVPAGTKLIFRIEILSAEVRKYFPLWMDYGVRTGMGQWRNSGKGRFTYVCEDVASNGVGEPAGMFPATLVQ